MQLCHAMCLLQSTLKLTVALESLMNEAIQQRATVITESGTAIGVMLELVQVCGLKKTSNSGTLLCYVHTSPTI